MFRIILTILLFLSPIKPVEFKCQLTNAESAEPVLTREKKTKLCIHFLPFAIKIVYDVKVDSAAAITIRRGFETLQTKDNDFILQFQDSKKFSVPIPYYRNRAGKHIVFSIIAVRIHLEAGEIVKIENESLSSACTDSEIPKLLDDTVKFFKDTKNETSMCPVECGSGDNDSGKCDLKLFITWVGTDKKGNSLISASEALTNFANYNLEGMFKSITETNIDQGGEDPIQFDPSQIDEDVKSRIDNPPAPPVEEEKPTEEKPTEEKPTEEKPTEETPVAETPVAETPVAES